jgi:hypothetical protein
MHGPKVIVNHPLADAMQFREIGMCPLPRPCLDRPEDGEDTDEARHKSTFLGIF